MSRQRRWRDRAVAACAVVSNEGLQLAAHVGPNNGKCTLILPSADGPCARTRTAGARVITWAPILVVRAPLGAGRAGCPHLYDLRLIVPLSTGSRLLHRNLRADLDRHDERRQEVPIAWPA